MIDSKTEWFQRHAREMERRTRWMERQDRKLQRSRTLRREMRDRRFRRQKASFPFNLLDGPLNFILMTIELKVKEIVSQALSRKLPRP